MHLVGIASSRRSQPSRSTPSHVRRSETGRRPPRVYLTDTSTCIQSLHILQQVPKGSDAVLTKRGFEDDCVRVPQNTPKKTKL